MQVESKMQSVVFMLCAMERRAVGGKSGGHLAGSVIACEYRPLGGVRVAVSK